MKNILFHMSVIFLLFVMVVMNTGETASARSVYKHKQSAVIIRQLRS